MLLITTSKYFNMLNILQDVKKIIKFYSNTESKNY